MSEQNEHLQDEKQQAIIADILTERTRQDALWGIPDHPPPQWLVFIVEELGETARAIQDGTADEYRTELTQVAALCISAILCSMREKTND